MGSIYNIYQHLADLIARLDPQLLLELKANNEMQLRFDTLLAKKTSNEITTQENDELNHFIIMERLMRMAKIKSEMHVKAS
jgi:hypothetical protein